MAGRWRSSVLSQPQDSAQCKAPFPSVFRDQRGDLKGQQDIHLTDTALSTFLGRDGRSRAATNAHGPRACAMRVPCLRQYSPVLPFRSPATGSQLRLQARDLPRAPPESSASRGGGGGVGVRLESHTCHREGLERWHRVWVSSFQVT